MKKMKSIISFALAVWMVLAGCITAGAVDEAEVDTVTKDGFVYLLNDEYQTASVVSTQLSGELTLPNEIKVGKVTYKLTRIEPHAFENNGDIVTFTVPEGIGAIGGFAFAGCTGMTDLYLPYSCISFPSTCLDGCTEDLTVHCYKNAATVYAEKMTLATFEFVETSLTLKDIFSIIRMLFKIFFERIETLFTGSSML